MATTITNNQKPIWKVFWDLQCPYSRRSWEQLSAIQTHFGNKYDFEICLTSLLFHRQAFPAQCAANLVSKIRGDSDRYKFIHACMLYQDEFRDSAAKDLRPSEVNQIFASIAQRADIFTDDSLNETNFASKIDDWESAVQPAWIEHKAALAYGVVGTPKHVIDGRLLDGTDSEWGPDEFEQKLKAEGLW